MMEPGRSYSAGNQYRYGFGGQEKSDEIKGEGNSYTAEFWEYDPRIGKRWNIDPMLKAYESSYLAFAGNPIWLKDKLGNDTTKYYDNKNNLLMTIGNGKTGYNHVMIVNDNKVEAIKKFAYENALDIVKKSIKNNVEVDNFFMNHGYGVVYDINSFKKFFNDNKSRMATYLDEADKFNGKKLAAYGRLSINGKSISGIRSETTGGLVLQNNIVAVGNSSYFINESKVTSSGYPNNQEPDMVGGIHDHPFGGDKGKSFTVDYSVGGLFQSSWRFYPGPSPDNDGMGDKSSGNKPKDGYRNVLVDDKNIYLYDNNNPDIIIPRK